MEFFFLLSDLEEIERVPLPNKMDNSLERL